MSSKDKENKTLMKLKQLFRKNKSGSGTLMHRNDTPLTQETEKEISPETPMSHRIKTFKELSNDVIVKRFDDKAITTLLTSTEDMLADTHNRETRHIAFHFLTCLCRGQSDRLHILRAQFFRKITNPSATEDLIPRFELLYTLTENGKHITYFEEEIGDFLLQWMPDVTAAGKTLEFLSLLVNVIKFNASYIDEDVINGFVAHICLLCCSSGNQQLVVLECLKVLDTIVCYSCLPNDSLATFIGALCRTVNHEAYCQSSWKTMRNLLGTHLGHAALLSMCRALQEPRLASDPGLLRGAVFHVNMGLWGGQRVKSLLCSPAAVLPSFLQALKCNHPVVMYEVMLSIQLLINKSGCKLLDPTWDNILDVIEAIIVFIENSPSSNAQTQVAIVLHDTLCTVEQLVEVGSYNGSVKRIFELIERCAPVRPESSVLRLVSYLATSIVPTRHLWLSKLNQLMDRYFRQETRTNVRIKVIDVLNHVIEKNRMTYEDELMERIVIFHLQNIATDTDVVVRNTVAGLLVNLVIDCESKRCLELLDILDKLLKRPFDVYGENRIIAIESDLVDVKTVVVGLIKVFIVKIYQLPSSHAIRIYKMLVNHLEMHYSKPYVFENANYVRLNIFETFLKIRANASYHIGYPDLSNTNPNALRFSPYISINCTNTITNSNSSPPGSPTAVIHQTQTPHSYTAGTITQVSLRKGFKCFVTCLKQEKDWEVLLLILQEVPKVMQNKTLILSRHGNNEIDLLATALCDMINDKSLCLPETLRNTTVKLTKSDFHAHVLPVLASLASYHAYLDSGLQKCIVRSLVKFGLASRCSRQCITALTTCTLEMRDVMVKMLPEVLLDISKFSATVIIAIPILEFLSTLTRIPDVFASFVGDQYMSVFAISLPFTNPSKYHHYTVSLAHHVIAVWFLKCRLSFRKDFVKYITNGLKTNLIAPFEERHFKPELILMNEDSSNRKRSSSLTEQGSRGRRDRGALDLRPPMNEALNTFHTELTETCIDLMARYTFSLCSALPKRLPTADYLLSGGQSMTWLLGNMLITITTSGCSQKALKDGLCDKCWSLCKPDSSTPDTESDSKRYSKSTMNRSTSGEDSQSSRITRQSSAEMQKSSQDSPIEDKKEILAPSTLTTENLEQQLPSKLHQLLGLDQAKHSEPTFCTCWCQGWAEICVRRPTGDMSWVMRLQNQIHTQTLSSDFPLNELATLYMPSFDRHKEDNVKKFENESLNENPKNLNVTVKTNSISGPINIPGSPMRQSPSRQNSHESIDDDNDGDFYDDNNKSRNPVRRSNSSPEMTTSWKNPFMTQEKIDKISVFNSGDVDTPLDIGQKKIKINYCKDMRVSCEAIPEEMSGLGTTPPTNEVAETNQHQLQSFHSYPGTNPPTTANTDNSNTSVTVPTSPITLSSPNNTQNNQQTNLFKTALKNQNTTKSSTEIDEANQNEAQKNYGRPKNLPVSNPPLTAKPPQSPTQTTPRFQRHPAIDKETLSKQNVSALVRSNTLDKQTKFGHSSENVNDLRTDLSSMPIRRDRVHTISVMSQERKPRIRGTNSPRTKEIPKSGISPSFVFLQLYHSAVFGSNEKPLLIGQSETVQRSLQLLDTIPPYEIHRIGVIYVGRGQNNNQAAILRNTYGSLRYVEFLQKLGTMIKLQDVDPQIYFLGGLDQHGKDGKFAYIWHDDVIQMVFHVATMMPNSDTDPSCNEKIKHIGNDFVTIVYNESGEEYNMIKGSFNFCCIVIEPLDHNTNRVTVKAIEDLVEHIGHSEPKIISDQNLAILTRQLALHANLASLVSNSSKSTNTQTYASSWLSRLRHIKRLRTKVLQEIEDAKEKGLNGINTPTETDIHPKRTGHRVYMDDFTDYT